MKLVRLPLAGGAETLYVNLENVREVLIFRGEITAVHISYIGSSTRVISGDRAERLEEYLKGESATL